eukprot:IDg9462t1
MLRHFYKCAAPVARRRKRLWVPPSPHSGLIACRFATQSRDVSNLPTARGETGGFELTFLGTSSQGGACRYPSSLAVRLRGSSSSEVWIFDAGEGCIAQLQRSYMRVGAVRNIFVTHVHGDHLYGLPGLVLSVLARRHSDAGRAASSALPLRVFGPPGVRNFLRMALGVASSTLPLRDALQINEVLFPLDFAPTSHRFRFRRSQAYWRASVRALPFETTPRDIAPQLDPEKPGQYTFPLLGHGKGGGRFEGDGAPASVIAAPVLHTVPCLAYTVREHVITRRFDKEKLTALGVPATSDERSRELFQTWMRGDPANVDGRLIKPDEVLSPGRRGRSICIVGDTQDASGAAHIAQDVDVLVHEATKPSRTSAHRASTRSQLDTRCHVICTSRRSASSSAQSYIRRVLGAKIAHSDSFVFRRFVGFVSAADCARQRGLVPNAYGELVRNNPFRPLLSGVLGGEPIVPQDHAAEDVVDSVTDNIVDSELEPADDDADDLSKDDITNSQIGHFKERDEKNVCSPCIGRN